MRIMSNNARRGAAAQARPSDGRSIAYGRSHIRQFLSIGEAHRRKLQLALPVALALLLTGCSFLPWLSGDTAIAATEQYSYPIVDTGQELTYDNSSVITAPFEGQRFYGQDAQVDGNQPSYVDNSDGTVTDLVTGLMWQQGYSGKMSQSEAAAGASGFNLAGYTDWRLPTIKELYSLIDFSGEDVSPESGSANNPFIDTAYFEFAYGDTSAGERIIDSQWATSTIYVSGGNQMFGVNFADGRIKGYGMDDPRGGEMQFYVRYVRGNTAYGKNDFLSNGAGTVTDLATGLMWSQNDSGIGVDWADALAYVQDLNDQNYLGYSDWYLPNAKELQSIVDYGRSPDTTNSAAIDPIFNVTSITNEDGELDWGFYWTSTTHASQRGGQSAVYIAFGRGLGYMNGRYVDVHGAGCQRSDPKSGSAEPYGRGPQGDVVRVQNFVRPVRVADGSSNYASTPDASSGTHESPNSPVLGSANGAEYAFASEQDEDFILFAPIGGTTAYLIDRDGNVVHDWSMSGRPGNSVYLLEGGNLLATYTVEGTFKGGGIGGGVEMLTWDGEEAWSFELATDHAHLHHDVEMLPNGNVLLISWEAISRSEALAAGLSASQLPDAGEVWSEMILEYDPDQNRVVWEWHLWDHALPIGEDPAANPDKIDLGFASNRNSSDWWHFNSIDYSAELDQIVISSRAASEFWIIDHNLTTDETKGSAGDLLYRFGNPAAYSGTGAQVLVHQHDAEFLDDDTILVFDNGDKRTRPYSRVVELDLPDYASSPTGVLPDAEIVWQYPPEEGSASASFFADHISGAQRLENGNTLICSGTEGRFFEVTSAGEIVWEYVNPFTSTGPDGKESNEVFRCESYSSSHIGQDLSTSSSTSLAPASNSASADLRDDQVGTSSSLPLEAQNVAPGQPPLGSGSPPQGAVIAGPPGIASISPASITVGSFDVVLTIRLDGNLAPPAFVQFTRVAIGEVEATTWTRNGLTLRAWFDIPPQLPSGTYTLTITFPGRNQEPITFTYPIDIR